MWRTWTVVLLLAALPLGGKTNKKHSDYVPDRKTAERMAEAILIARFGEERVSAQQPLLVDGSNKDYWIVQGSLREKGKGSGIAVWINKHSGCIVNLVDHMK
jgi:hypothetical protein